MKLAILGASGHGKVVADLAEELGYEVFFFDDAFPNKMTIENWAIHGNTNDLFANQECFPSVTVAIGNNSIRELKIKQLLAQGFDLPVLAHPGAYISRYASFGVGTVVFAGAAVNAYALVGQGVIINTNSVVEHDCQIGDYSHISPNAALAGGSKLGVKSWLGIGACTKQLIEIGSESTIGAGSVVVKNIPSNVIAYGNPAKVIQEI